MFKAEENIFFTQKAQCTKKQNIFLQKLNKDIKFYKKI